MTEGGAAAKAAGADKGGHSAPEEGNGETVLLLNGSLHLPSHGACGSGEQSAAEGLRPSALEMDSSAAAMDGDAVLARVGRHILPLFFSLALLNSIDRGAGTLLIFRLSSVVDLHESGTGLYSGSASGMLVRTDV